MRVDKKPDDPNGPRPGFRPGKEPKAESKAVTEQATPPVTVDEETKKKAEAEALQSEAGRVSAALVARLNQFQTKLTPRQKIGVRVGGYDTNVELFLENVHCHAPDMVILMGKDHTGNPTEYVVHYSQLNVTLFPITTN